MKLAMRDRNEAGGWAAIFAMLAALLLTQAFQMSNGEHNPPALILIGLALVSLVCGVACSQFPAPGPWSHQFLRLVGFTAVAVHFYQLATTPPGWYLHEATVGTYVLLLAIFAALTGPVILEFTKFRRVYLVAWLAAFSAIAIWIILATPNPPLDVYRWAQHSLETLQSGNNPYTASMPNVDGKALIRPDGTNTYGRPLSDDLQWVHTGYPYLPFSLMLAGGGYIFGDLRLASVALILAGAMAMLRGRGTYAALGAALLLTMPRIFLVIQQSWTDAHCFGLLALTACLAARGSRWTPWLFGLTLVSKQYMVFLAPLGLLLIPPPWERKKLALFIGQTLLSGTIVTLPWILWNPGAWFDAVFPTTLQFRPTSLSFVVYATRNHGISLPDSMPFLMMLPAFVLVLLRSARGPAGFALSSALVLGMFSAFSRTSYGSQYFLVLGCALTAFALTQFKERPATET